MSALLNRNHWAVMPVRPRRRGKQQGVFRPRLKILEDRTLPSATLPVSIASSGTQTGNGSASPDTPAVSANGQYEAFTSNATDLVNGVTIQLVSVDLFGSLDVTFLFLLL